MVLSRFKGELTLLGGRGDGGGSDYSRGDDYGGGSSSGSGYGGGGSSGGSSGGGQPPMGGPNDLDDEIPF